MNIIWLSANKFGYELLKEAFKLKNVTINAIITLSNKSKTIMYDRIKKEKWYEFNTDVFEITELNEEKRLIKKISPELVIICGWRQIIDKNILTIPKNGFIGFHPTLLPKGRGPAPIINSILQGFKKSGVTMFYISSEKVDSGKIIGQEKFTISKTDHAEDVYNKVIKAGEKLIKTYMPMLIQGNAPKIPQEDSEVTLFKKLSIKDNKIDFKKESVDEMYRKIKALSKPYKGAYIEKDGKKLIIWRAELKE